MMTACRKEADTKKDLAVPLAAGCLIATDTLQGEILTNTSKSGVIYLKGIVYVAPSVTLTIAAGSTIVGSFGSALPDTINLANNKGTLVVEKGAKLIANGTATNPIVWTSNNCAGSRHFGDWGGLILLGNATIHTASGGSTNTFEALPSSDPRNSYGGGTDTDSSGSVTFNRFEFGGGVIAKPNQEVNGVTFCGIGSKTVFNHVEVTNSGDDGFEWFGGAVNCDHLIDFSPKDDEYDFDEGYHGKLQFIIAYRTNINDNSGSHCIETDNDASATTGTPHTNPFISNATFVGPADSISGVGPGNYYDGEIFVRRNSRLNLLNSLIIAQAQPYAFVVTPTTCPLVTSTNAPGQDFVYLANNIFQTNSANPVVKSSIEGNPVVPFTDACSSGLLGILGAAGNTSLSTFADFKLDGALAPQTGSPALTGGVNLSGQGFVGTTQRGAVITTDLWTSTGTWISTATN